MSNCMVHGAWLSSDSLIQDNNTGYGWRIQGNNIWLHMIWRLNIGVRPHALLHMHTLLNNNVIISNNINKLYMHACK